MRFLSGAIVVTLGLGVVCAGVTVAAQGQVTIAQNEAAMKQIGQSNGAMQKLIKANDLAAAQKEAETLVTQFTLVERFFTQHKKDDAMKLAATARQGATDVVAAIKASDQMKAQMAAGNIGGTCKQCHGMYREGNPQEGFRIKADAGITD
jgi:cytochrome c556